jgi:hypothetical protein
MYQINKRFFIGIGIVEALCLIFWIFASFKAAAAITLVLNTAYFTLFFVGLKMINEEEADLQKQIEAHDPNLVFKVSKQDIEKFKKEGALMVDGKELINRDFELWKENKKHQERQ